MPAMIGFFKYLFKFATKDSSLPHTKTIQGAAYSLGQDSFDTDFKAGNAQ